MDVTRIITAREQDEELEKALHEYWASSYSPYEDFHEFINNHEFKTIWDVYNSAYIVSTI